MIPKTIKALSVRQPWAWLIAHGYKDTENRTWNTNFRGKFLIHASLKIDKSVIQEMKYLRPEIILPERFQVGGIIGEAEIVNCVRASFSEWFFGPYGFLIKDAKPLPFQPYKGQLGFFDVTIDNGEK